jgi:hypothetical protein
MNWPAVAVSLVIALAVSMFVRGGAFPFKLFLGSSQSLQLFSILNPRFLAN